MKLAPTAPSDAAQMAQAHAGAFEPAWKEADFEDLLDGDGVFGVLARGDEDEPLGVILCRLAGGEMEVLTLGVRAEARRTGVARALMAAAVEGAVVAGATACFLEVAVDNAPAIALYEALGFRQAGLRKSYYDRGAAGVIDARVMRLDLNGTAA